MLLYSVFTSRGCVCAGMHNRSGKGKKCNQRPSECELHTHPRRCLSLSGGIERWRDEYRESRGREEEGQKRTAGSGLEVIGRSSSTAKVKRGGQCPSWLTQGKLMALESCTRNTNNNVDLMSASTKNP
ncbi:unnamed protein product [Prunus armeniaca]|uniref:Uncharacterized protein n=1 Tax=Prunus armeniaca TaxID=36596 RepID=A0A6J5XAY8_PRUAR|nr:unnamed protein product [Prunus armeniaca]